MSEAKDEVKPQPIETVPVADTKSVSEDKPEAAIEKTESKEQEAETAADTKKRGSTQEPEKRKRHRRRQYDDAPKEEPESEEGEDEDDEKDPKAEEHEDEDEDEDDNLGGVDASNIIPGGRRTRGKKIDYKKANEEVPLPDDDEEDDEEFEDKGDGEE